MGKVCIFRKVLCWNEVLVCKLKTLVPHGLNTEIGDYAKEMDNFYWFTKELYHKFQYYVHMMMKDIADLGLN